MYFFCQTRHCGTTNRREEDRVSIEKLADSAGVELHLMSNETEEGVQEVKTAACDKLLQARVDARMAGKKVGAMPWYVCVSMGLGLCICVLCLCVCWLCLHVLRGNAV